MQLIGTLMLWYFGFKIISFLIYAARTIPVDNWLTMWHYIRAFMVDGVICCGWIAAYYAVVHGCEWAVSKSLSDSKAKTLLLKKWGGPESPSLIRSSWFALTANFLPYIRRVFKNGRK